MKLLDGKVASQAIKDQLREKISWMPVDRVPHLAAILVGNNPASEAYVGSKVKNCEALGMKSTLVRFGEDIPEEEVLQKIEEFNQTEDIDGILVQLPLPGHISEEKVIMQVTPSKDVDGFHPVNVGKMALGLPSFVSATPYGILLLLEHYDIETSGKDVVIIGRSNIVGTPLSILLSRNEKYGNATVTLCHSRTKNIAEVCRRADILVAAIGKSRFIKADMIKEGAIVIDVGINREEDPGKKKGYALVGDVDFVNASEKTAYISPVPGGVGLMTIAALLQNTYNAFMTRRGNNS